MRQQYSYSKTIPEKKEERYAGRKKTLSRRLILPSANIPGITPESAFTDGYLTALHTMDEAHSRVRIGDDGKASDMNPETEMSPDGCNPVSKDSEMERAHDGGDDMIFPGVLPGMPGVLPGGYAGAVPPFYFPGSGSTPGM